MKMRGERKWILSMFLLFGGMTAFGQDRDWEVPGDHFSLEGALELFKKSASPEDFERQLNSPETKVNNLDLNGDGYTDYIRVIDKHDGAVHIFILQAMIGQNEGQDVAVISLEKLANGKAVLQITGDADVYGMETIIEPTEEVRINAGTSTVRTVVNVWYWPSVQYVYSPYYTAWVSPWHWTYRPVWWRPWQPVAYVAYYPRCEYYRPYYTSCHTHRVTYVQHLYRPYRTTSVVVYNRHHDRITHYRSRYEMDHGRDRYTREREQNHASDFRWNQTSPTKSRTSYHHEGSSHSAENRWSTTERNHSNRSSGNGFSERLSSRENRADNDFRNTPSPRPVVTHNQRREIQTSPVVRQRESRMNNASRDSQQSTGIQHERGSSAKESVHRSVNSAGRGKSTGERSGRD